MSGNLFSMMDLPIWVYEAVMKNTKVSAQNVDARITLSSPGERLFVFYCSLGLNDYAAARDCLIYYVSLAASTKAYLLRGTIDNQNIFGPARLSHDSETTNTVSVSGLPIIPFPLTKLSYIWIRGVDLAQNEELTFRIEGYHHSLGSPKPTVALFSVTDRTLTESINEIV